VGFSISVKVKERLIYMLRISLIAVVGSAVLNYLMKGPVAFEHDLLTILLIPLLLAPPIAYDAVLKRQKITDLNQQLQQSVDHDALTNTKSRKFLFERYEGIARANAAFPLAVMQIDADHFKRINDTYGHMIGDKALKHLAGVLQSVCRGEDVVCRIGGEEFALVLPGMSDRAARAVAMRVLERLNNSAISGPNGPITVQASIGITLQQSDENLQAALARADRGLYCAKDKGRNCAMMVPSEGAVELVGRGVPRKIAMVA
jgi:diguanylate cyclase (GGDEF)-like protein